jgi:alpha-1,3-fucosyltransferase
MINILTWGGRSHSQYLNPIWYDPPLGGKVFETCAEKRCRLVSDLSATDAVLMSQNMLMNKSDYPACRTLQSFQLPAYRAPRQKWVFVANEPPSHRRVDKLYAKLFNVTFTYKNSSNAYFPYGRLVKQHNKKIYYDKNFAKKRNVVWMVSNCESVGKREHYVAQLAKHIDVTIFGTCARKRCIRDIRKHIRCQHDETHKFYLAFENSLCSEYISEKVWRTLGLNMIPIVYGIGDYKNVMPPRSYIDVRDYESPAHLAQQLQRISSDRRLHASYFAWKQHYAVKQVGTTFQEATCQLCDSLHRTRNDPPRTIDLHTYWNEDIDCIDADVFLQKLGVNSSQPKKNLHYLWTGQHRKIV